MLIPLSAPLSISLNTRRSCVGKFGAFCLFLLLHSAVIAEIFGDGVATNGIEDQRLSLSTTEQSQYQRFFGTIECFGQVTGTAMLLDVGHEGGTRQPLLITAKHVLPKAWFENHSACEYLPAGYSWSKQPLNGRYIAGHEEISGGSESLVHKYASDWTLIALKPWDNWHNNAYNFSIDSIPDNQSHAAPSLPVSFIGFDSLNPGFKIDQACRLGTINSDSPFYGAEGIVWDDCHSVAGSSGGILFTESDAGMELVAMRIGSLFDKSIHPSGPATGDQFDPHANTNVARLFDATIYSGIRSLLTPKVSVILLQPPN